MTSTPIIFLIFKRPAETARVFEEIRRARPTKLFLVADGPRNEEERGLVEKTRAIVEKVDWPCEVLRDYSTKNLGCRRRVWSGIDWAFSQLPNDTDGAIILEDDCLPEQSFFTYCGELLQKYAKNEQVLHIGGTCFQQDNPKLSTALSPELSTPHAKPYYAQNSYYFSRIAQIWGWATWKRAWKLYDGSMGSWKGLKNSHSIRSAFPSRLSYQYWEHMFDRMAANEMDTWDVAWTYTVFKEHGLCIMPKVNLIKNIGGGAGATHKINTFTDLETTPLVFPLTHPQTTAVSDAADNFTYKKIYGIDANPKRIFFAWMKDLFPSLFKNVKRLVK
jgi:hypothetical protein